MPLGAIIFDVDGTLAETEEAHRHAFNRAFAEAGRPWLWSVDQYRALLQTTGGRERIRRYLDGRSIAMDDDAIAALHSRKNAIYANIIADGDITFRPGVLRLIDEATAANVPVAIATTTSRLNLDALLCRLLGPNARNRFAAIVTGEDVSVKKPGPEVYHIVLDRLLLPAAACIAIEDSRNGLDAAMAAGIATVVTPSHYTNHEDFTGAMQVLPDLIGHGDPIDIARLSAVLDGHRSLARSLPM